MVPLPRIGIVLLGQFVQFEREAREKLKIFHVFRAHIRRALDIRYTYIDTACLFPAHEHTTVLYRLVINIIALLIER